MGANFRTIGCSIAMPAKNARPRLKDFKVKKDRASQLGSGKAKSILGY